MKRMAKIVVTAALLFVVPWALGQHPDNIDPDAASEKGSTSDIIWNIVIFGVLPLVAIIVYLIFRNKKNNSE